MGRKQREKIRDRIRKNNGKKSNESRFVLKASDVKKIEKKKDV